MVALPARTWWPRASLLVCATLVATAPVAATAQTHDHRPTGRAISGALPFDTTCRAPVRGLIDHGLQQVYTGAADDAVGTFRQAVHSDLDCTIAYWGVALAYWERFAHSGRADDLAEGWKALDQATLVRRSPSAREARYLAALVDRFRNRLADGPTQYARAMTALADANPTDHHAALLAALALLDQPIRTATEATARSRAALAMLDRPAVPSDHLVTRYCAVLSGDADGMAGQALNAARGLAATPDLPPPIAVAALRIFARLGLWDEAVAAGLRAADGARAAQRPADELAGLEALVYAQLQAGHVADARAAVRRLRGGYLSGVVGPDAAATRARIAARVALETDDLPAAVALADDPRADAPALFAAAIAAARLGRTGDAERAAARLAMLPDRAGLAKAATAWARYAGGHGDDALAMLRQVAADEDGAALRGAAAMPLLPAREQLGDLLMALGRPADAAAAYAAVLERWPARSRTRTRLAAARAAARSAPEAAGVVG